MTGFDSTVMKVTRVARLVVIASVLCVAAVSNSNAACTAATTHTLSPAACGVVISTAGCYNMTTNLVATSNSGDCVLITARERLSESHRCFDKGHRRCQYQQWNPRSIDRRGGDDRGRYC